MNAFGVQSVDQVCKAVEQTLRAALPQVLELAEVKTYLGDTAKTYRDVKEWHQLPTLDAIVSGKFPAIAITSPGLLGAPAYSRSSDRWETTWRIGIGCYDRGVQHEDTAAKVRNWIAFIRTALLRNPTLGGVARGLTWSGEEYDVLPARNQARTIAAGAVSVDVRVDVANTLGLSLPPVTATNTSLTVQTQE